MEQSPLWEATNYSASREILRVLWNLKVHYRVLKTTPLLRVSSVHAHPPFCFMIHFDMILPYFCCINEGLYW
jgi:hypothetical protein